MKATFLALIAITLFGCSGDPSDPGSAPGPSGCEARHGLYKYSLVPMGTTTCPALPETVFNADDTTPDMCQGGRANSADLCVVTLDVRCPSSNGYSVITRGKVTWSPDASRGSGTLFLELDDEAGAYACSGTYAVSYTRL